MKLVTDALDGLWEVVLNESTDDEGVSFDTNSISQQSSASHKKQIRWLLPRESSSYEESFGDFSDTAVKSRSRPQPTANESSKQKWSFRKKNPKTSKTTKKDNNSEQESGFWSFFDASIGLESDHTQQQSAAYADDSAFWSNDFGFFEDDRDDQPSRDTSNHRRRDKHRRRSLGDEGRRSFNDSSSSHSSRIDVWEDDRLLGAVSDTTMSTQNSTRDSTDGNLLNHSTDSVKPNVKGARDARVALRQHSSSSFDKSRRHSSEDNARNSSELREKSQSADPDDNRSSVASSISKREKRFRWGKKTSKRKEKSERSTTDETPAAGTKEEQHKVLKNSGVLDLVICRGKKDLGYDKQVNEIIAEAPLSGSIRSLSSSEERCGGHSDRYASVRLVPDGGTSTYSGQSLHHLKLPKGAYPEHTGMDLLADSTRLTAAAPISMYVYASDENTNMGVAYDDFKEQLQLRTYAASPSPRPDEILIKVEASTVSHSDCIIHRGDWWKDEDVPLPNTPGVDVVGVVREVNEKVGSKWHLKVGDRVAAFIKWGGNARYATVKAEQAVQVRENVDPAAAVCLPETYLSAFQALHIGQSSSIRYGQNALRGKSILVVGALSSMGKAVVELAYAAGSTKLYATAKPKHHEGLRSIGVRPLDRNVESWLHRYRDKMDLVLIADSEQTDPNLFKVLRLEGSFVLVGRRVIASYSMVLQEDKPGILACTRDRSNTMKRTHAYDVFESWERNATRCKHDLRHLLLLLAAKAVNPHIVDRVPLEKVGRAHKLLNDSKRVPGVFVCEPWVKAKRRALFV